MKYEPHILRINICICMIGNASSYLYLGTEPNEKVTEEPLLWHSQEGLGVAGYNLELSQRLFLCQ